MTLHERSYGAIVFRQEKGNILYLLLLYERGGRRYWDFPKGHDKEGEDPITAMKRELAEETGIISIDVASNFKEKATQIYKQGGELTTKCVTYFLAKTRQKDVRPSFEHKDAKWFPYEDAVAAMTFKNTRGLLVKAHQLLCEGKAVFQRRLMK